LKGPHPKGLNLSASGKRAFTFSKIFEWILSDQKRHTIAVPMQVKPVTLLAKLAKEEIIFLLSTVVTSFLPPHPP
jgi:hypothetical protein